MRHKMQAVRLTVRQDGFSPQAFRWEGELVRVLGVDRVYTHSIERRYRVRTWLGRFELSYSADAGAWFVRRSPSRLSRLWSRTQEPVRYSLPAWRRRARRRPAIEQGGSHADGLALV